MSSPASSSSSSSELTQTWTEFLPGAWCVEDLLSNDECQQLIQSAQDNGIHQLAMQGDLRHRERVTCRMELPKVSKLLWDRVKDQIPAEIVIDEGNFSQLKGLLSTQDCPEDFIGRWTPSGVNTRINVAYCSGVGHLAAHRDADHVVKEHQRSFLTINGYLTDRPKGSGGATRFLVDDILVQGSDILIHDEHVLYRVESDKAGKAVIFHHGLLHDGEPLAAADSPPKWIFRALVYYQREPETAPKLSKAAREARQILKQAIEAEEAGEIGEAIKLYKKAYRLDPSLDN